MQTLAVRLTSTGRPAPSQCKAGARQPRRAAAAMCAAYAGRYQTRYDTVENSSRFQEFDYEEEHAHYDDAHYDEAHYDEAQYDEAHYDDAHYEPEESGSYGTADNGSYAAAHNGNSSSHGHQEANGFNPQAAIANNPLFTSQFMGVLQESLARQGAQALTANTRPEEPRASATEEVLTTALQHSKQQLQQLMVWKDQIERQIAVQQKQVDRMEFALNKCRGDAAYMRALKEMLHGDL